MAKKKNLQPAWHPNFRDPDALPDIKVVRTDFTLNLIACALALALIGLVGFNEYYAMSLSSEISKLESKRTLLQGPDKKSILTSNNFVKQADRIGQVADFVEQPESISEMLLEMAGIIPKDMLLTSFNYAFSVELVGQGKKKTKQRQRYIEMKGTVVGNPEAAPIMVDEYRQAMLKLPTIEPNIESIRLASLVRDDTVDAFNFTLYLLFKPLEPKQAEEAAKPAKK